jgi:Holliday junction resolvase RusA-like endonuclease
MMSLSLLGTPRPQPRPRFVGPGRTVSTMDKNAKLWKGAVINAAKQWRRESGCATITAAMVYSALYLFHSDDGARDGLPHTIVPDADNLDKMVWDALKAAKVIKDDSLIWKVGPVEKRWTSGLARATIRLDWSDPTEPRERIEMDAPGWLAG